MSISAERDFEPGDKVRFSPTSRVRASYEIDAAEIGEVVGLEYYPPESGPTYRMEVEFPNTRVAFIFSANYELVTAFTA